MNERLGKIESYTTAHKDKQGDSYRIYKDDLEWLIEQARKYQRVRDRVIEQSIEKNHEALRRLADS
jgi:hypothetical protein